MAMSKDCNIVIIHLKEAKKNYRMDICRENFQRIQNGAIIIDKQFETIYYFPETSSNHEVQAHMKNSSCRIFPSVYKCLCSLNQQKINVVLANNKCAYATDKTDSLVQICQDLSNKYGKIFDFEYDALKNCLKEKTKSKNDVKDVISLKHTETFHSTADCSNTKHKSQKMKTSMQKRITALMPRRQMKEELDNQKYFPDSEIMVEISTCPIFRTNNRNPPSLMTVVNSNIDPYSLSEVHSSLGEIVSDCAEPDSIVVPSSPQPQPSHQTRTREYAAHNATVSNNNPIEIRPEEESSLGSIPASIHCAQEQNANRQRLPIHPRYSTYDSRIASYATFKEFCNLDTKELATTGLFYTGKADEVQCFQCGIEHRNWTPDKNPLLEHIRESPDCLFLEMHLGVNTLNQYKVPQYKNYVNMKWYLEPSCLPVTDSATHLGHWINSKLTSHDAILDACKKGKNSFHDKQNWKEIVRSKIAGFGNSLWRVCVSNEADFDRFSTIHESLRPASVWQSAQTRQHSKAQIRSSGKISGREPFSSLTTIGEATGGTSVTVFTASDHIRSPQYQAYPVRLSTFTRWPPSMQQKPEQVAQAGFYYTGLDDVVRCFACDGGLKNWDPEDEPWIEHARWFPLCPFVQKVKGQEFIDLVRRMTEESDEEEDVVVHSTFQRNNPMANPPDLKHLNLGNDPENNTKNDEGDTQTVLRKNESLKSIVTCITCKTKARNTLFLPCSHHCLCQVCAEKCSLCPVCKKVIQQKIKTFMI